MDDPHAEPAAPKDRRTLERAGFVTYCSMAFERLWPLLLPILILATAFAALSWFGLFRSIPDTARWALAAVFSMLALVALYPLLSLRLPKAQEVAERIEAANDLRHQPIAVQSDRPAGRSDPVSDALWQEHQRRMAEKLAQVASDSPRPQVPRRDPFALRAIPALVVVVALGFSLGQAGGSLGDILRGAPPPEKIPSRIDAWLTPPAYTGRAPIFLTSAANSESRSFTVPEKSDLTLRIIGGSGKEQVKLAGVTLTPIGADGKMVVAAASTTPTVPLVFKSKIVGDSALALMDADKELRGWQFKIIPDMPPKIEFASTPDNGLDGKLTLSYKAVDDYGVTGGKAILTPHDQAPGAHPLYDAPEIKLTSPKRTSRDGLAKSEKDLGEHPWAGAPVSITLTVVDAANQEGRSAPAVITLPEKIFSNPVAKAVLEWRRLLAMDTNSRPRILELMDAVTMRPDDTLKNPSHFLGLHTARLRLASARNDGDLRDVVAYFWQIANGIENSGLSDAQKRLRDAQEKLAQAIENGASDAEIEKLMAELKSAMRDVTREFAEKARKDPKMAKKLGPNDKVLSQSELEEMLKKLEELAKEGAKEQAKELLSQLNEMMNNLQAGNGQEPGGEQGSAMNEQLNKLGEMMRKQQELMDQTQRLQQGQSGEEGESGGGQGPDGQNGQSGEGDKPGQNGNSFSELQGSQGQLREDLEGMMDALRGLGLDPGKEFGKAGDSMGQAEGKLGKGQGGEALGDQSDALEALRKGGQGLMKQMQEAMGRDGGGKRPGQRGMTENDPLGRPRATTGPDFGDTTKVPDEIDVQRAREILEAIRKRLGNAISPEIEKNYLERLLNFD
jgi:uncharacterized protein (TIGR02302 family)